MAESFSFIQILGLLLTAGLALLLPLALSFYYGRKNGLAVWAGSLGFIIPQLVIRLPLLSLLGQSANWLYLSGLYPWLGLLFYPLTAALFETTGRFLVLALLRKKTLAWPRPLAAGLGHAAAESVLLVGLNYAVYLVLALLPQRFIPQAGQSILLELVRVKPAYFYLAGLERLFVLPIQVFFTCLLAQLWQQKKLLLGLALVFIIHTGLDIWAVSGLPLWLTEAGLACLGLAAFLLLGRVRSGSCH